MAEDKVRNEQAMTLKLKVKCEERDEMIRTLELRVRALEAQVKSRDDEAFRRASEYDKLNALIEQKLELTEKELEDSKLKCNLKDKELKEVNKDLF